MSIIHNVVIAGVCPAPSSLLFTDILQASGDLGRAILHALIESRLFTITVLTRQESSAQFDPSLRVVRVDYTSVADLTAALTGQDAVVSVLNSDTIETQLPLIEASLAAGVKRFIPSEFSANNGNPKAATLPAYKSKIAVHEVVQRHARENPQFTYSVIRNGPFLDWCLDHNFFLAMKSGSNSVAITTPFYDGGDRPFSTATLATIGKAVVGVLRQSEETRNRVVFVHDLVTTQQKILALARKIAPDREWSPVDVNTAEMEVQARENYDQGKTDILSLMGCFIRAVFAEGYGGEFEAVDNELLGIPLKTDGDLEELVRHALAINA